MQSGEGADMIKAVIFDMDGTLWDASEEVAHSWQEAIQASTITDKVLTKEDFMRVMGKPMDELIEVLFPELSLIHISEPTRH